MTLILYEFEPKGHPAIGFIKLDLVMESFNHYCLWMSSGMIISLHNSLDRKIESKRYFALTHDVVQSIKTHC